MYQAHKAEIFRYTKKTFNGNDVAINNILTQYPQIKPILRAEIDFKYFLSRLFEYVSNNEELRIRICFLPILQVLKIIS